LRAKKLEYGEGGRVDGGKDGRRVAGVRDS